MKRCFYIITAIIFILSSCTKDANSIQTIWVDKLQDNYSFVNQWSYNENVFENEFGQLVCDGLCDPALDHMRDKSGRLYPDSLTRYYQLLDTTHYYHTLQSEAQCYEWLGTDFANAYRGENDTIRCRTQCNAATHSSLEIMIIGDNCIPQIELNSVSPSGIQYFNCIGGYIKIDKSAFMNDSLKAEFNFTFENSIDKEYPIWWKGKIYTKINTR